MATNASTEKPDALRDDLDALRADVGQLASTLKEMAAGRKAEAYESIRNGAKAAQQKVNDTSQAASEVVVKRPLVSVAVAFGVGMLLGNIVSRRRS